jgi:lipopolysaccharide assembly protein A
VTAVWVFRLIVFLLLLILLVYLFATNAGQTVDLRFFGQEWLAIDVFWVVVVSFALGLLAALVGMGLREVRHRRELGRLRRQTAVLQRELTDLRSLPLQELTDRSNRGHD